MDFPARNPGVTSLFVLLALFVSPLILGTLSGRFAQRDDMARFLRRLGFRTVHYIPTAWDWHFSRQEELWARITMEDGSGQKTDVT